VSENADIFRGPSSVSLVGMLSTILCAAAGILGLAVNSTTAMPRTHWTTYLRAGPGLEYAVLDELQPDTALQGAVCAEAWCRVKVTDHRLGDVAQSDLALPPSPSLRRLDTDHVCIRAGLSGYEGEADPFEFCHRSR
jgi:hypothetical protein